MNLKNIFILLICLHTACYSQVVSPDSAFGINGIVSTSIAQGGSAYRIKQQPDVKIVLMAAVNQLSGLDLIAIRYNQDGSPDSTFGTGGIQIVDMYGFSDFPAGLAIQPDGKILLGANTLDGPQEYFAVVRLNTDGTPDSSFNQTARARVFFYSNSAHECHDIALQPDGKILLAGYVNVAPEEFAVARLDSTGLLDPTFNGNGKVLINYGAHSNYGVAMALQPDGKILMTGSSYSGAIMNQSYFMTQRLKTDGSIDTSFHHTGIYLSNPGSLGGGANCIAVQPDGKIIIGGYASNNSGNADFAMIRYDSNGYFDSGFGNNGKVNTDINNNSDDEAKSILLLPDGGILLAGETNDGIQREYVMVKYDSTGLPDLAFGINGKVITAFTGTSNYCLSSLLQQDGKVVLTGGVNYVYTTIRYLTSFSLGLIHFTPYSHSLLVYPNPLHGNATLKYVLEKDERITLQLTDINGRIVKTFFTGSAKSKGTQIEDIYIDHTISQGNYLLVLSNKQAAISIKVTVK